MLRGTASYDRMDCVGPPAAPLAFPMPTIFTCHRKSMKVKDHLTGIIVEVSCFMVAGDKVVRAYAIKKKIAKNTSGAIHLCVLLKTLVETSEHEDGVDWKTTDELVALKQSSWSKMRAHGCNPLREAAALLHVGDHHPHVLGCQAVFQDADYLYIATKYCAGGDLYIKMQRSLGVTGRCHSSPNEIQARVWFSHLVRALSHLQRKGVCHLNISLENLLIDDHNNLLLIDFGLACRVPYTSACIAGGITDISDGVCRRLIDVAEQGGDLVYLAPEMIERIPLDGFACDIWSAGIVLFILLVDMAPFRWAHSSDLRFRQISSGYLKELLQALEIPLSEDACDLLQNLLWHDPRKRFNLSQIMAHPWLAGQTKLDN